MSPPQKTAEESCTWCGREVEREDGFRVAEVPGQRRAVFCRLEHIVPWTIQGARWEPGEIEEPAGILPARDGTQGSPRAACDLCGEPLSDVYVLLVRHRGEHRIPDAFCSAEHLAEWAKGGGRWRER